mmetsp:Transcript_734/g.2914  ORF Transcript_734/g.2914 Transcript_734/m.2914 type:complete len:230 (-) Transcript_734:2363-3052(-)
MGRRTLMTGTKFRRRSWNNAWQSSSGPGRRPGGRGGALPPRHPRRERPRPKVLRPRKAVALLGRMPRLVQPEKRTAVTRTTVALPPPPLLASAAETATAKMAPMATTMARTTATSRRRRCRWFPATQPRPWARLCSRWPGASCHRASGGHSERPTSPCRPPGCAGRRTPPATAQPAPARLVAWPPPGPALALARAMLPLALPPRPQRARRPTRPPRGLGAPRVSGSVTR